MDTNRKKVMALAFVLALILNDFRRHDSLHALGLQEASRLSNTFACVAGDDWFYGAGLISLGLYGTWLTAEALAFGVGVPRDYLDIRDLRLCKRRARDFIEDPPTAIVGLGGQDAKT